MRCFLILFILLCLATTSSAKKKYHSTWNGAKVGMSIPTNVGRTSEQLGFHDVASFGVLFAYVGRWYYNKRLTLGWDLGYQLNTGKKSYWDVDRNGQVSTTYQSLHALIEGNYYFSHGATRPYLGISFGGYYLINSLDFDSNYGSVSGKESLYYKAKSLQPGFSPQGGVVLELSKNTLLDISTQFVFIPNLEESYQIIEGRSVTLNPHGNQNHVRLTIGLWFKL